MGSKSVSLAAAAVAVSTCAPQTRAEDWVDRANARAEALDRTIGSCKFDVVTSTIEILPFTRVPQRIAKGIELIGNASSAAEFATSFVQDSRTNNVSAAGEHALAAIVTISGWFLPYGGCLSEYVNERWILTPSASDQVYRSFVAREGAQRPRFDATTGEFFLDEYDAAAGKWISIGRLGNFDPVARRWQSDDVGANSLVIVPPTITIPAPWVPVLAKEDVVGSYQTTIAGNQYTIMLNSDGTSESIHDKRKGSWKLVGGKVLLVLDGAPMSVPPEVYGSVMIVTQFAPKLDSSRQRMIMMPQYIPFLKAANSTVRNTPKNREEEVSGTYAATVLDTDLVLVLMADHKWMFVSFGSMFGQSTRASGIWVLGEGQSVQLHDGSGTALSVEIKNGACVIRDPKGGKDGVLMRR